MIDIKKLKSDPDWFQKKIQEKGINILVKKCSWTWEGKEHDSQINRRT